MYIIVQWSTSRVHKLGKRRREEWKGEGWERRWERGERGGVRISTYCAFIILDTINTLVCTSLLQVALSSNSLCHTHVFVLDAGKELFVWCGGKSKLNERSKARLITERMNKLERKGRATIHMFRAVSQPKHCLSACWGCCTVTVCT